MMYTIGQRGAHKGAKEACARASQEINEDADGKGTIRAALFGGLWVQGADNELMVGMGSLARLPPPPPLTLVGTFSTALAQHNIYLLSAPKANESIINHRTGPRRNIKYHSLWCLFRPPARSRPVIYCRRISKYSLFYFPIVPAQWWLLLRAMEIMNYGAAVAAAATAAALHFYCYICFAPAHAAAAAAKTNRAPTNKKINSARQLIFGRCFQLFFIFVRPPRFDLAACAEQTLAACANREPKLKAMRRGHRN